MCQFYGSESQHLRGQFAETVLHPFNDGKLSIPNNDRLQFRGVVHSRQEHHCLWNRGKKINNWSRGNTLILSQNLLLQIPSQMSQGNINMVNYNELIYAYLTDADGSRLTYTHYTGRVPFDALIFIRFNRPVYIQKHKVQNKILFLLRLLIRTF